MENFLLPLLLLLLAVTPHPVRATWSIVAIDKTTHQLGNAMATCLDNDAFPDDAKDFLDHAFSTIPCRGAIVAQASIQDDTGPAAAVGVPLLQTGSTAAQEIVKAITAPEADPGIVLYETSTGDLELPLYNLRQYGVVTFSIDNPVASYTGPKLTTLYRAYNYENTEETTESIVTENYTASVQGNIVFPGTVTATATALRGSKGCDFPERLFASLKQGYLETDGDVRCAGNPATKGAVLAYLKVMEPDGMYSIDLEARFGMSENMSALDAIEAGLLAWRQENPCGAPARTTSIICSSNTMDPSTNSTSDANDSFATTMPTLGSDASSLVTATLEFMSSLLVLSSFLI